MLDGRVLVAGAPVQRPDRLVDPADALHVTGPPPRYVGRGGHKLEAALAGFGIDPTGWRAIDVGASTGGFTDCLLQHGALSVVAIDVGRHQLHEKLRADPRVVVREQTDVRDVVPDALGGPVPLVVADLSFIGLTAVLDAVLALVAPGGRLVVLVKPQFEAGRAAASRGRGVIRDPEVWSAVLRRVGSDVEARGAAMMGLMVSPITGSEGNVEFLALVAPGVVGVGDEAIASLADAAVARACSLVAGVRPAAHGEGRTVKDAR